MKMQFVGVLVGVLMVIWQSAPTDDAHCCFGEEPQAPAGKDSKPGEKAAKKPPKLYDTEADGNQQIAEALETAKAENKQVLLKFGANWCGWCHKLSKCFKSDAAIKNALEEHYVLLLIDVDVIDEVRHNADVVERYGNPTKHGLPVLVVLDSEGKQLTTQDTALLEEGDHHDPAKVSAFLERWIPAEAQND